MEIQKWNVPERLTARQIPRIEPSRPIHVQVKYEMPDELKLIIFGGFVAVMAWFMLSVFVVSFSQPRIIIIQPDGSIIRE